MIEDQDLSGDHGQHDDGLAAVEGDESESEPDIAPVGFSQLLKQYGPTSSKTQGRNGGTDAAVKAKAKAKVKASAKPVVVAPAPARPAQPAQPAQQVRSSSPKGTNPASLKIDIGRAARSKRTTKSKNQPEASGELDLGMGLNATEPSGLCEADRNTLDHYEAKLASYKDIKPPLADGPFKSHLTDMSQKINAVMNEVKTKKRSAIRRAGKEHDPLYESLDDINTKLANLLHLVKCFLGLSSFVDGLIYIIFIFF